MSLNFLNIIAKHHQEWIGIINSFGSVNCAEDLVQEGYIKMQKCYGEKELIKDGEPNRTLIWFVLRSVFIDYHRQRKKIDKVSLGDKFQIEDEPSDDGFEQAYDELIYKINKEKQNWHWYDRKIFDLYTGTDMSLRDMEKQIGINYKSIWLTVKNCEEKLKEAVGEDYIDFCNGDYDKI